tara:strand:- start:161 stop:676 length:516 start_codon:yes stop_codon:yes gene_type:complete
VTSRRAFIAAVFAVLAGGILHAPNARAGQTVGPVTNMPIPRFVSMKASTGNVRRGPSTTHRIDWIFKRRDMPLKITAEHGHWRRVQDQEGAGGWMHYALLSGVRTVLASDDMMIVYARPDVESRQVARFERGVIARLGSCSTDWCEVSAGGYSGWASKQDLWGVLPDETRD